MSAPQRPVTDVDPVWPSTAAGTGLSSRPAPTTAPAVSPPRWSGKKTAVAAALAIGFSSVGAVAAAATVQQGTGGAADSPGGPGGGFGRQGPLGTRSQQPPGQGLPQQGTGTQQRPGQNAQPQ